VSDGSVERRGGKTGFFQEWPREWVEWERGLRRKDMQSERKARRKMGIGQGTKTRGRERRE